MSAGWEASIRVQKGSAWGVPGTVAGRGIFLFADSESLDYGAQAMERDSKLSGDDESPPETFGIERYFPRGEFVFQPRVDDFLMICMAHFQNVVKSGTGTYEFYRQDRAPLFTEGGSNIGTHPYTVNIDLCFGHNFAGAGGKNGIRFMNGIVESLNLTLRWGEDLICTPNFKFRYGSYWIYPADYLPFSAYGSRSEYNRLVDYHGTVDVAGESFEVESWEGNFNNNTSDRSRLGERGYSRFPFTGKWIAEGNINMEIQADLDALAIGSFADLTVDVLEATNNQVKITQPNIVYKPYTIPVTAGDAIVEITAPYRAYPPSGTTGPSTILRVYTGTTFGTNLLGF